MSAHTSDGLLWTSCEQEGVQIIIIHFRCVDDDDPSCFHMPMPLMHNIPRYLSSPKVRESLGDIISPAPRNVCTQVIQSRASGDHS